VSENARISLDWPGDADLRQVGTLVLGGVAARTDAPVDRVEELGFALESLAREAGDVRVQLDIAVAADRLVATIGPFETDPLADDALRRVVDGLTDEATTDERDGLHRVALTVLLPQE